ncbi:hypothetical protein Glove_297g34 [Diversispora epigaea]|uniref:Uncharacterized protein n=1 Tax=Diversispora epigaea TaxID=1348612 RepID=A0A397HXV0_9GLOM|nr:hypothetical protein Glove_297g34 [Diversispora epigaea]
MTETIASTIVLTRATRKTKVGAKTRTNTTKRTIKTTELTNNWCFSSRRRTIDQRGIWIQNLDNEVGPITRKIKFYSIRLTE